MAQTTRSKQNTVRQKPAPPDATKPKTYAQRYAAGKALREICPRNAHTAWKAPVGRPDAVQMLLQAEEGRIPDLLPLRHGRMVRSAFSFYRGAALTMASDLSSTPSTAVHVQCCGDAHLCNFGGFATPERRILFSINDLDETHPAPWEWDVKRLAASFVVTCRDRNLGDPIAKDIVMACARSYRESMADFSQLKTLELWYQALWAKDLLPGLDPEMRRRVSQAGGTQRELKRIFPSFPVIKDQLPTIFHAEGFPPGVIQKGVRDALASYRATLPHAHQLLLDRYELSDGAIKVVGVGSVGTTCWVLLFMAGENDPLFLQVKEARASVLEAYISPSIFLTTVNAL